MRPWIYRAVGRSVLGSGRNALFEPAFEPGWAAPNDTLVQGQPSSDSRGLLSSPPKRQIYGVDELL